MELVGPSIGAADLRKVFCSARVGTSAERLSTNEALCPQGNLLGRGVSWEGAMDL